jgi:hypothetical protein
MSLVIDKPRTSVKPRTNPNAKPNPKRGLRNLKEKFPFAVEWVSYADLQSQALAEEWRPRQDHAVAASFDGNTLAMYFN